MVFFFFFQADDEIRVLFYFRGLGDVYSFFFSQGEVEPTPFVEFFWFELFPQRATRRGRNEGNAFFFLKFCFFGCFCVLFFGRFFLASFLTDFLGGFF